MGLKKPDGRVLVQTFWGHFWQGKARQGKARQGKARRGEARQGKERQGLAVASFCSMVDIRARNDSGHLTKTCARSTCSSDRINPPCFYGRRVCPVDVFQNYNPCLARHYSLRPGLTVELERNTRDLVTQQQTRIRSHWMLVVPARPSLNFSPSYSVFFLCAMDYLRP
jgi:hypothetical protein